MSAVSGPHAAPLDTDHAGRRARRTSPEGPWLPAGWKSDTSPQEMRAEFIEDKERADTEEHLGDSERKRRESLIFAWGLGFLLRIVVWCVCLPRHREQKGVFRYPLYATYALEPGVLVSPRSWKTFMLTLPGHSLDRIHCAGRLQRNRSLTP